MYEDKHPWYFDFERRDIEPLLPARARRVLEVGCGAGATLRWLRDSGRAAHTTGIELSAEAAAVARTRVDTLLEGPLERWMPELPQEGFDLVLALDVLEHLVDPWDAARRLQGLLKPGGVLIASLPNVRNHRVVLPLLLRGRWEYRDAGIMDRTHLRFFSRHGARELLEQAGLVVDGELATGVRRGDRDYWRDRATLGVLRPLFVVQYLLRAARPLPAEALAA